MSRDKTGASDGKLRKQEDRARNRNAKSRKNAIRDQKENS